MIDLLDKQYIEKNTNYNCIILDEISSTNTFSKSLEIKENTVVIANYQSEGRGRLGRNFVSNKDKGIYMSIVLNDLKNLSDLTRITCLMAVITSTVIDELTGLKTNIKWVNDIYLNDKKLCGILVEAISKNNEFSKIIIGIGINVYKQEFPTDLQDKVISLENITKKIPSRNKIITAILNKLDKELVTYNNNNFMKEYKKRSNLINRLILVKENDLFYQAKVLDINEDGSITIEKEGNKKVLYSGTIERIIL